MTHALEAALDEARSRDLEAAARALLRQPLLRARGGDGDAFRLVRRHAPELRAWFEANTGWRLHVDSEVARLVKLAATNDDPTHPAREPRSRLAFSRRRYVLACLALSVLERADSQITLGRLAEGVIVGAADERLVRAGITFELSGREERGDLVAVVRLLLQIGVLARVAGDEEAFMRQAGDALYDVDRRVLAVLLAAPRGPSMISAGDFEARLEQLSADPLPSSDELRKRAIRHRLTRRLLDDPVLYFDELTESELAYLTSQRAAITRRVSELTGLVVELRAEGIAMVDPEDELSDVRMPDVGTDGHVALLVAEHLTKHLNDRGDRTDGDAASDAPRCAELELHQLVRRLAAEHKAYWRRSTREPGAELSLVADALDRLAALRLVRRHGGYVYPLPALARFGVAAPTFMDDRQRLEGAA
jgi:uncharacterized protein (TIGR02678 family)